MAVLDQILFPPIDASREGHLEVDDVHRVHWEECGNPSGVPVLYLHGGPGAGCDDTCRRFFDPRAYRILLFNQRGAKRSQPLGETRQNSPRHLLSDMEALRCFWGVEKWHLFGGSWGSTLALLYAQEYPQRCLSLTLRGISLFDTEDLAWWFRGMGKFFPELWQEFARFAPSDRRDELPTVYYEAMMGDNEGYRMEAVRAMHAYVSGCGEFLSTLAPESHWGDPEYAKHMTACYKLFVYYSTHFRFESGCLLNAAPRLAEIPGIVLQGRHDVICPPIMAHRLHQAWPQSDLVFIPNGGHSSRQPCMARALIDATNRFKSVRYRSEK